MFEAFGQRAPQQAVLERMMFIELAKHLGSKCGPWIYEQNSGIVDCHTRQRQC